MSKGPQSLGGITSSVVGGNQAITTQSFTELNSKLGSQFEAAFYSGGIPAGASVFLSFEVGASADVLVKDIDVQFNSELISSTLFVDPVFSGGSAIQAYNFKDSSSMPADVILLGAVVPSSNGTQISPEIVSIGSTATGNKTISAVGLGTGIERVLSKGSTYLYRITNLASSAVDVAGVVFWYQGPLSVD